MPPWEWDVQMLEGSLGAAQRALNRGVRAVVADHQDTVHFDIGLRPLVMGRVNVRKRMADGGGGHVLPSVNRLAKPCPKLLLDFRGIR